MPFKQKRKKNPKNLKKLKRTLLSHKACPFSKTIFTLYEKILAISDSEILNFEN